MEMGTLRSATLSHLAHLLHQPRDHVLDLHGVIPDQGIGSNRPPHVEEMLTSSGHEIHYGDFWGTK